MNATTQIREICYSVDVFDEAGEIVDQTDTLSDTLPGEGDYDAWRRFIGMETASSLHDVHDKKGLSVRVVIQFSHWFYKDEVKALRGLTGEEYSRQLAEIIHEYHEDWTPYRQEKEETCPHCGSHFQPSPPMIPGPACLHCLKEIQQNDGRP